MTARFRLTQQRIPRASENDVESSALDYVRLRGYRTVRLQSGLFKTPDGRWVRVGEPGLPDYVALHRKHPAFFIETKRPGASVSAIQIAKHAELLDVWNLPVVVVDGVATLRNFLERHERSP